MRAMDIFDKVINEPIYHIWHRDKANEIRIVLQDLDKESKISFLTQSISKLKADMYRNNTLSRHWLLTQCPPNNETESIFAYVDGLINEEEEPEKAYNKYENMLRGFLLQFTEYFLLQKALKEAEDGAAEKQHKKRGPKAYDAKGFFDRLNTSKVKDKEAFVKAIKAVIEDMPHERGKGRYIFMVMWAASKLGYFHKTPNYYEMVRALKMEESETDRKSYENTANLDCFLRNKPLREREQKSLEEINTRLKTHLQEAET